MCTSGRLGCVRVGSVNPFPIHEQFGVHVLIPTPKDAPADRWRFGTIAADEVQDGYEVVNRMSEESGIVTAGAVVEPIFATAPLGGMICVAQSVA